MFKEYDGVTEAEGLCEALSVGLRLLVPRSEGDSLTDCPNDKLTFSEFDTLSLRESSSDKLTERDLVFAFVCETGTYPTSPTCGALYGTSHS